MDFSIFRAYDIRGTYPDQINDDVIYRIARNFNKVFKKNSNIVVGYDARKSSRILYEVFQMGLKVAGMNITEAGLTTTPMIAFLVESKGFDGGIIISASHNPQNYNGIKIIGKKKGDIGGKEILKLIGKSNLNQKLDLSKMIDAPLRRDAKKVDYANKYVDFLLKDFDVDRKLKIVFDCSDGSTGPILNKIIEKFPDNIERVVLNSEPDGDFPSHGPDPSTEEAVKFLKSKVLEEDADIGIAFDADGDRAIFIDEKGDFVRPEYIWRLLVFGFGYRVSVNDVASSFLTNILIEDLEDKNGIKVKTHISKVGRKFIPEQMKKFNADVGFESAQHYYFKDFWDKDSGFMGAVKVIRAVSKLPYKISDFVKLLPKTSRLPEIDLRKKIDSMSKIIKEIEKKYSKNSKISKVDGISAYKEDAWFNIRKSNTQDIVRLNIESDSAQKSNKLKSDIMKIINKIK